MKKVKITQLLLLITSLTIGAAIYAETQFTPEGNQLVLHEENAQAALVLFPGAYFKPEHYLELAHAIHAKATLPISIYLSRFSFDIATPLESRDRITPAIREMMARNFDHPEKRVFVIGHSQGGIVGALAAAPLNLGGLLLLGAYVPRTAGFGISLNDFKIPVLTLGGELDGRTGVPYLAREYRSYLSLKAKDASVTYRKPVVLLPGINHMSFADGRTANDDLPAETSLTQGHSEIADLINAFIMMRLNHDPSGEAAATLDHYLKITQTLLGGFLRSQDMDREVCAQAQRAVAGYDPEQKGDFLVEQKIYDHKSDALWFIADKPALLAAHGQNKAYVPVYLEYPFNIADVSQQTSLAPALIACKMKNQKAIEPAGPYPEPGCAQWNARIIETTFALLEEGQKERFLRRHSPPVASTPEVDSIHKEIRIQMGDLTVINSEKSRGDQWLLDLLKFTPGEGGWTVRTASLHTPVKVNGGVTDGVFYCKTVAPSRLMEWFLLDSLL